MQYYEHEEELEGVLERVRGTSMALVREVLQEVANIIEKMIRAKKYIY